MATSGGSSRKIDAADDDENKHETGDEISNEMLIKLTKHESSLDGNGNEEEGLAPLIAEDSSFDVVKDRKKGKKHRVAPGGNGSSPNDISASEAVTDMDHFIDPLDRALRSPNLKDPAKEAQMAMKRKRDRLKEHLHQLSGNPLESGGQDPLGGGLSLDDDVACVDAVLFRASYATIGCWIFLAAASYRMAPPESIQRLEGTERSACIIELFILITAVCLKHASLLWTAYLGGSRQQNAATAVEGHHLPGKLQGSPTISGILFGGLVVQCLTIVTMFIMVFFPVPVMIDPVLGSRVHLMRWCEWTPLASLMTLMTECIDAPRYNGQKLTHAWKEKFFVSLMQGISTIFGLLFPFCQSVRSWTICMIFSCITFLTIVIRYYQKRRLFHGAHGRKGSSVDEIELFDRSRLSLSLLGVCCAVWSLMVVMYFISSYGHNIFPKKMTIFHDPAVTMLSECLLDLIAKLLYMSLILEAHYVAFDESKRVNRRLAELKNTMSVVWESSSDVIAISVQKNSGCVTSMVSPSLFRPALTICEQDKLKDTSAFVMDISGNEFKNRRGSICTRVKERDLPEMTMKFIHKSDFAGLDLHTATQTNTACGSISTDDETIDAINSRILAITDMLVRAWQTKPRELVFEHDVILGDGSPKKKFEVKVTRLEKQTLVVVARDVTERYRRFEAEKQFVFETTARQKDADANRFTRHEVKNGILSAIEICSNVRDQASEEIRNATLVGQGSSCIGDVAVKLDDLNARMDNISELDQTLHEVLDIVLAEAMARDVVHGKYVPSMERVDMNYILSHTRGFNAEKKRFSLLRNPSSLPIMMCDQAIFKCIHGNAIRNALKYGKKGGQVLTEATYDHAKGEFEMKIINMPGPGHDKLLALGSEASERVFSQGTCLHFDWGLNADLGAQSHSAGDGAWIIRRCALILGGECKIEFEKSRTVFIFHAPVKIHHAPVGATATFQIPSGVWGIAIDDSKIQRKLLRRFFMHAGIKEQHQVILGKDADEICGFVKFIVDFVSRHPGDLFLIIADENLEVDHEFSSHNIVFGSECIQKIRRQLTAMDESRILALVRSANDSPEDLALYCSRAHGYMPKVPLQGLSVRDMIEPLWEKRFPKEDMRQTDSGESVPEGKLSRVRAVENISQAELMQCLRQVDILCVRNDSSNVLQTRWPVLWDKLYQLKGDLKSVNVDDKLSQTVASIEELKGDEAPGDFMSKWLRIRSEVVLFCDQQ